MIEENRNVTFEIRVSEGKPGTDPEAPDWEVAELEDGVWRKRSKLPACGPRKRKNPKDRQSDRVASRLSALA